jgi:anti-sigma regulatory factor (Ser/Thr protein kinase)
MAVVALPHAAASAGVARRRLVADLRRRGVGAETIADAELVLTEMVGNAVRHARPLPGGELRADWDVRDHVLVLRVTDGGASTRPTVQQQIDLDRVADRDTTGAERGRGLAIVAAVASGWGSEREGRGLRTWATIDLG